MKCLLGRLASLEDCHRYRKSAGSDVRTTFWGALSIGVIRMNCPLLSCENADPDLQLSHRREESISHVLAWQPAWIAGVCSGGLGIKNGQRAYFW